MPDKWAKYAQPATQDRWAKYAQPADAAPVASTAPFQQSDGSTVIPPNAPTVTQPGNAWTSPHPLDTLWANAKEAVPQVLDIGKGIVKGAMQTGSTLLHAVNAPMLPLANGGTQVVPALDAAANYVAARAVPHNTLQRAGKGLEQAAEFIIPGSAEEAGAAKLTSLLPNAGGLAKAAIKAGVSGVGAGGVNALQGGSFGAGAITGAGGSLIGSGLKTLAPIVAETALGVRGADRATAARAALHMGDGASSVLSPGEAILQETSGMSPRSITQEGTQRVGELTNDMQRLTDASDTPVSLNLARGVAGDAAGAAKRMNNASVMKDMGALNDQLTSRPGIVKPPDNPAMLGWAGPRYKPGPLPAPGRIPIPPLVSASDALSLKRGVGELVGSWNPNTASDFSTGAAKQVYGALDRGIDDAAPGTAALNDRISSLLPVVGRAGSTDLNAGMVQRMIARGSAHTGALMGPIAAATAGFEHGGVLGGVVGGAGGLVGQELLTNPTVLMAGARAANSPLTRKLVIPALSAGALQLNRPKE